MFDSLFESIKVFFTIAIIGIIAIIVIVAIVKGKEHYEYQERKRKDEQDIANGVSKIKAASKHWSRDVKLNYMNYLSEEHERLEACQRKPVGGGYATKTVIMASINGEMDYFSVDLDAIYDLYHYLDVTLDD